MAYKETGNLIFSSGRISLRKEARLFSRGGLKKTSKKNLYSVQNRWSSLTALEILYRQDAIKNIKLSIIDCSSVVFIASFADTKFLRRNVRPLSMERRGIQLLRSLPAPRDGTGRLLFDQ